MPTPSLLLMISIAYLVLLFTIAWRGERRADNRPQPWVYALSLAVYCSSWSFLGTSAQASHQPWAHLPIFLGPALLVIVGWPMLQKLIRVCHRHGLTSVADLIAARFGRSQKLALTITLWLLIGLTPYLALQLKAVSHSVQLLLAPQMSSAEVGALTAFVLAGFTALFGIRSVQVTERHPGLMLAVAVESLVKVGAFALVGVLVLFAVNQSPDALWQAAQAQDLLSLPTVGDVSALGAGLVMVIAAFLCLPRQFHVLVVENHSPAEARLSRWLFPLYLMVFAVFAVPLGMAGRLLLAPSVPADGYVLTLPLMLGHPAVAVLAFLGALSAASAMIIIESVALATMLSNNLVLPLLLRRHRYDSRSASFTAFADWLLFTRRALIALIVLLGYCAFLLLPPDTLGMLGELSFGAVAQIFPALVAALYSRRSNPRAVFLAIIAGALAYLLLVILPRFGVLPGLPVLNTVPAYGTLLALFINGAVLWSTRAAPSAQHLQLAARFVEERDEDPPATSTPSLTEGELIALTARFVGKATAEKGFSAFRRQRPDAPLYELLAEAERLLATVMGSSSARQLLRSALAGRAIAAEAVADLLADVSSERARFSQALISAAIENASEGISVIDPDLCLVAWNHRYLELFEYPPELVQVGCPIATLIRYNAERGLCGPGDVEEHVNKRLAYLRQGSPHASERRHLDGRVIRIQGNPLPGGGFVMLFSDITAFRDAEQHLQQQVAERTSELQAAQQRAEQANAHKTLYLRAVSHDLMQPLEAARLLSTALASEVGSDRGQQIMQQLHNALDASAALLTDLADMARLDSGKVRVSRRAVDLQQLCQDLFDQFRMLAPRHQVDLRLRCPPGFTLSDPHLLRRLLHNLLANACRYGHGGKVLLAVRRHGGEWRVQVHDQGPGINAAEQQRVFEPFVRGETATSHEGLGLGLFICRRICDLLGHRLSLRSQPGHGCCFEIGVPATSASVAPPMPLDHATPVSGWHVLVVDNDQAVRNALVALLEGWEAHVSAAASQTEAVARAVENPPDLLIADYQLDGGETGMAVAHAIRTALGRPLPGLLISASADPQLDQLARDAQLTLMRKPIRPARLRAQLHALGQSIGGH